MESKQMIEILISAIHTYCKSFISDCHLGCNPCQCLIRITNNKKCQADELLSDFNPDNLVLYFRGIEKAIDLNVSFPNCKAKIDDINGKTIKYLWKEYNSNRQKFLNYEPSSVRKTFIQSLDIEGIVTKYIGDEVFISPMYVFEAMKQFSVFDENINKDPKEINTELIKIYEKKEIVLAYILDLFANNIRVPENRTEGGYDKQKLMDIGKSKGLNGETFYKYVKNILSYDLNKKEQLELISKDWYCSVCELSENKEKLNEYLIKKKIIV